jgi:adenylate cyclase
MSEEPQRKLAAIVAADVVGYSRLMGVDEIGTIAALRNHRTELIDPVIAEHGGRIVKTMGDGLLLEFPSVVNATQCAIAMQQGMAERNQSVEEDRRITFRIGINLGDIVIDGEDILGDGVNIAARIEEIATPGGIALSRRVHEDVQDRLEIQFEDMGERTFKNISRSIQVWGWSPGEMITTDDSGATDQVLTLPDKPSIVVLPFNNMSGDPDQDYFSDGISEDLTTALSRFDGLFVIARNSAFTYKGQAIDVKRVGQELGVRYLLEGSIRRAGDRVRVNAQLIDAEADRHVWAERFDRQVDDIFELQDDIVATIAATVGPEITLAEVERVRSKRPDDLRAWDLYLRAISLYHTMTEDSVAEAVSLLNRAIEIEPDFGVAYGLLGMCHGHIGMHGWVKPVSKAFEEAVRLTEEAVRLAPSSPETNYSLAFALSLIGDPERAITAARRAIDLNPNHAEAFAALALALVFYGDLDGCLAACERSARSNPRDARGSHLYNAMGHAYYMLGDYEKAIEVSKQGYHLDPSVYGQTVTLAASYARLGNFEEAKRYVDDLLRFIPRINLRNLRKNPMFIREEHIDNLVDGMRLAGLPE